MAFRHTYYVNIFTKLKKELTNTLFISSKYLNLISVGISGATTLLIYPHFVRFRKQDSLSVV